MLWPCIIQLYIGTNEKYDTKKCMAIIAIILYSYMAIMHGYILIMCKKFLYIWLTVFSLSL